MDEKKSMRPISLRLAAEKAETYYQVLRDPDDPDYETALDELSRLVWTVSRQPSGDANDFHNFAVNLAKNGLDYLACEVLKCGLEHYPKNCDLLSDYMQYGMKCGLREECAACFDILSNIPKRRYTWRSFSFSIAYLRNLVDECDTDEEIDELAQKMLDLSDEFLKYLPYDEEAYRSRATVYEVLRNPTREIDTLKQGLDALGSAPRCALQLADILVDRGEYKSAIQVIQQGISGNNKDQSSINEAYMYYLLGRAKLGCAENNSEPLKESDIMEIYAAFNTALSTLDNRNYRETIRNKVIMLMSKTALPVPPDFENLFDLVEE